MLVLVKYRLAGLAKQSVVISATSVWAAVDQVVRGLQPNHGHGTDKAPALDYLSAKRTKTAATPRSGDAPKP